MKDHENDFLFLVKAWFQKFFRTVMLECHQVTTLRCDIVASPESAAVLACNNSLT